jgi:hypothetical protein
MMADHYGARSSIPARPTKNIFSRRYAGIGKPVPLIRQGDQSAFASHGAILKQRCVRFNGAMTIQKCRTIPCAKRSDADFSRENSRPAAVTDIRWAPSRGGGMKRLLSASVLALSLAGCGTAAFSWDAYEHEQCTAMGYQRGTPLYLQCRSMVAQSRLARDANVLQGLATGLQMTSRPAAPPPVSPMSDIRCVTTPIGRGMRTTRCD